MSAHRPIPPRIFLDHVASAPLLPAAREAALRAMATLPGHASSPHYEGRRVRAVVEEARSVIADALGCQPRRVIFASGATEAARLAVDALAHGAPPSRRRVLCSPVEHPAVGGPVDALRARGFEVERLALNRRGALDVERLAAQMDEDVAFAAITLVNHDTGVIYGNSRIADIVTGRGAASYPMRCWHPAGGKDFQWRVGAVSRL